MKMTKSQLRQIIKEELENVLNEGESMKDLQDSVAELEIRLKRRRAALEKLKAMDPDEQRDKDIKKLEDEGHDTGDWKSACEKAMLWGDTIYTGLFHHVKDRPALHEAEPILENGGAISNRSLGLNEEQSKRIIDRMM